MPGDSQPKMKDKLRGYLYQVLLIVTGATIAFVSTTMSHRRDSAYQRKGMARYLAGCADEDIRSLQTLISSLKQYPLDEEGRRISPNAFRWLHQTYALEAVASNVGCLKLSTIQVFAKYMNMTNQTKSFRDTLQEDLGKQAGEVRASRPWILAYIDALEINLRVARELRSELEDQYGIPAPAQESAPSK